MTNKVETSNNVQTPSLNIAGVMRPLFLGKIEKTLLNSKRFRKCDWQDVDGIMYLKMMDSHSLSLAIRDVIRDIYNGA